MFSHIMKVARNPRPQIRCDESMSTTKSWRPIRRKNPTDELLVLAPVSNARRRNGDRDRPDGKRTWSRLTMPTHERPTARIPSIGKALHVGVRLHLEKLEEKRLHSANHDRIKDFGIDVHPVAGDGRRRRRR